MLLLVGTIVTKGKEEKTRECASVWEYRRRCMCESVYVSVGRYTGHYGEVWWLQGVVREVGGRGDQTIVAKLSEWTLVDWFMHEIPRCAGYTYTIACAP